MKPINTLCGQNVEILNVKAGGTYSYVHCALKLSTLKSFVLYVDTGESHKAEMN
jgi:hypothetical protein